MNLFKDSIPNNSDFASQYNELMFLRQKKVIILGEYDQYIIELLAHFKQKYNPPIKCQIQCCLRHKKRGDLYFMKCKYKKAIEEYKISIYCNDNSVVYQNRALCYLNLNEFFLAAQDIEKAQKFNTNKEQETKLYYIHSLALKGMGKYSRAFMQLDKIKNPGQRRKKQIDELKWKLEQLIKDNNNNNGTQ